MGHQFLVLVDAHSKWMEVFQLPYMSPVIVIGKLQTLFTQFGIPQVVVTDSRPSLHKDCIRNSGGVYNSYTMAISGVYSIHRKSPLYNYYTLRH